MMLRCGRGTGKHRNTDPNPSNQNHNSQQQQQQQCPIKTVVKVIKMNDFTFICFMASSPVHCWPHSPGKVSLLLPSALSVMLCVCMCHQDHQRLLRAVMEDSNHPAYHKKCAPCRGNKRFYGSHRNGFANCRRDPPFDRWPMVRGRCPISPHSKNATRARCVCVCIVALLRCAAKACLY